MTKPTRNEPRSYVVTIAADGDREVVVGIPESRLEEIRAARELQIQLWARPGKHYTGRVRELAPMTDSAISCPAIGRGTRAS